MTPDLNGNLATLASGGNTTTYTWNPRNQLTGLSGPGLTASFGYDALGRRWTKTVNAAPTDYLYDGLNPVQEGALPTTPTANLLTGLGLDEFFTRTDAAGLRAFLTDALGSTLALTNGAGAVQTEYTYAPFGETTATGPASSNPYEFTGRENDATGLYSYRARYYHPELQAAGEARVAPCVRAPYSKIDSGMKAETIQFGASTISLIRRSAATLATT